MIPKFLDKYCLFSLYLYFYKIYLIIMFNYVIKTRYLFDIYFKSIKINIVEPIIILSIYNLITLFLVTVLLVMCKKRIRKERTKDNVLKYVSIAVVVLHYSSLYVDFFLEGGEVRIGHNMLFMIYPCNIIMWLLFVVALWKDRESKIFKILADFTFLVGTICGLVGVLYNFNFLDTPSFADYTVLKGLLSHTVMIFGTIYLGVMGYSKVNVPRTMHSLFWGLMIFLIIGGSMNVMFIATGIDREINALFMIQPPIPELPFLNFYVLATIAFLLVFVGLIIYERFAFPEEQRWLWKIKNKNKGV